MTSLLRRISGLLQLQAPATGGRVLSQRRPRSSWIAGLALGLVLTPAAVFAQGAFVFSPQTLSFPAIHNVPYSQQITTTGGTGSRTYALVPGAGTLPNGLTLSASGLISGTPNVPTGGTFNFAITVTDSVNATGIWSYSLTVAGPPVVANPTSANVGATTATLGGEVQTTGGATMSARGVVYALASVNPTPALGGPGVNAVPIAAGLGTFTVNVTGLAQGATYAFRAYATNGTGTGYSAVAGFVTSTLTFGPLTLPNAVTGSGYSQSFTALGGLPGYTFTVTSGALPTGLTLNTTGFITGIPTVAGAFTFTVTVTDSAGATRAQPYTILITPAVAITTTVLPDHGLNVPGYFYTIESTGGTGAKLFNVTAGSLPPGLAMDSNGTISGTPFAAGTYGFTVTVTDSAGGTAQKNFAIVIGAPVTFTTAALSAGSVSQTNYNQQILASGGTGFKTYTLASGTLPPGLALSTTGVLSGIPTTAGSYSFAVNATDALGALATRSFTVDINPALAITPTSLLGITLNLPYNQTINATGGTGAKTFAVTSGTLPDGLTLSSEGLISGTPVTAATYNFTITVTDSAGAFLAQSYTVAAGGPILITPTTLTAPIINTPGYSATLTASGGNGARTFALTGGTLPTGLSLSSAGVISGTATAAGSYSFTVTATDASGTVGTQSYTVVIAPPVMVAQTITFGALPNVLASAGPITLTATASSGLPVTYSVTGPATISGSTLTLSGVGGVVTITASQAGNAGFLPAPSVVQSFTVTPADRLVNLSSRVRIAPDANRSLITGFVVGGLQPKRVLVRAIGPGLAAFGVQGALVNPRLEIRNSQGALVVDNDNWSGAETSAAFTQVGAFALAAGSADAALVTTLAPGAYTMQITAGNETGIALAEVYDASANPGAEAQRLVNISTRGNVEPGDGVLIGGFAISGVTPKRVLIRGIGPTLGSFGVGSTLADPQLSVFSGTTLVAQNNNWSVPTPVGAQTPVTAAELAAVAQSVGAFALTANSLDSAVLVTLPPGSYTAQVSGPGGTTSGVALVEIYEAP